MASHSIQHQIFKAADRSVAISLVEAWMGAFAYSSQLYFDFSGYSDMAIGLARMFGIRLPLNFDAPYKSCTIIEFWQRWHMTLSRFLRDYLYIPLGGNRKGAARRYRNILATMLLGGLWHGAGWNFVFWGGLHGIYLIANHLWLASFGATSDPGFLRRICGWTLTYIAVVVAWVPFRAETIFGTVQMWKSMSGAHGILVRDSGRETLVDGAAYGYMVLLLAITLSLPTTHQYLRRYRPALDFSSRAQRAHGHPAFTWRPTIGHAIFILLAFISALAFFSRASEFLYFQF